MLHAGDQFLQFTVQFERFRPRLPSKTPTENTEHLIETAPRRALTTNLIQKRGLLLLIYKLILLPNQNHLLTPP